MNWPAILRQEIIGLFPKGILNSHPGDLPRYRGNACPNWAMLNGENRVALTIHQMDSGELDSGAILYKEYIPLETNTEIGEIYGRLNDIIPSAFVKVLCGIQEGVLSPVEQSKRSEDILRVYPRTPGDSFIDWRQEASYIDVLVRASSKPFAGAYSYLGNERVIIWKAYTKEFDSEVIVVPGQVIFIDKQSGEVGIATGRGILVLKCIEYLGNIVRPSDVLTSMRMRLGMNVEEQIEQLWKRFSTLEVELNEQKGQQK